MITSPRWRRAAVILAALALTLGPTAVPASSASPTVAAAAASGHRDLPEPPPADVARAELAELPVEAPHSMDGYSRTQFPHWITQYGT
ncbi:hypothetical protein Saa2_01080 [Streptomyces acidiscabies]|nr:hypothetical protein Saa2_01080 [Streptomyces acidiscabies]